MNKKILFLLLLLCVVAQNTWAQGPAVVTSELSLNQAIANSGDDPAHIVLGDDIQLVNHLSIPGGKLVYLDLNGYTLSRNLVDANANGHVIEVSSSAGLSISDNAGGGKIKGGRANNGGGICNYGTLYFYGGTITDCYAGQQGGGIKNNANSELRMLGGTILGCYGEDGGGIYNAAGGTLYITGGAVSGNTSHAGGGGVVNYGTAEISGGTIHNNHATTRGGGIWNNGAISIQNASIVGNRADVEGGGIYFAEANANYTLQNVTVSNNTALKDGGIYISSGNSVTIAHSTLSGNSSTGDRAGGITNYGSLSLTDIAISGCQGVDGGAIFNATGASLTIFSGTLSGNRSAEHGGGGIVNYGTVYASCEISGNYAYTRGGAIWSTNTLQLVDATIKDNTSGIEGGGIYLNTGDYSASLSNCAITGNTSTDGGGIFVQEGGSYGLQLDNCNISSNRSSEEGGGIMNYGTILLGESSIKDNSCGTAGGGIWSNGYLRLGSGTHTIAGNTDGHNMASNVYLPNINFNPRYIYCQTTISDNTRIGVSMEGYGIFTQNYNSQSPTAKHFFPDNGTNDIEVTGIGEASLVRNNRRYYDCSWDSASKQVVHTLMEIPSNVSPNEDMNLAHYSPGEHWLIADEVRTFNTEYLVNGDAGSEVHLVLCDGAQITFSEGLRIGANTHLHIHSQSYGDNQGRIIATGVDNAQAAIGGKSVAKAGMLTIHGGAITATGGEKCAGIGGAVGDTIGYKDIVIYDGTITATGGAGASGIGRGSWENHHPFGIITVYGGTITAQGGGNGCGISGTNDTVYIYGGTIDARGGEYRSGIGSGRNGQITIAGGTIRAEGGRGAAGIGGGHGVYGGTINISGGNIYAYGGASGAGIGCGSIYYSNTPDGGNISITGGVIHAYGGSNDNSSDGNGIGGGYNAGMGNITITGGVVEAYGGGSGYAVGGYRSGFTLSLSRNRMVSAGSTSSDASPVVDNLRFDSLYSSRFGRIEQCKHEGANVTITTGSIVVNSCPYCTIELDNFTFLNSGLWTDTSNWLCGLVPTNSANVAIKADAIIPADATIEIFSMDVADGGSVTLEDGAQLKIQQSSAPVTVKKNISAGGWHAITPCVKGDGEMLNISLAQGLTAPSYDLFRYDEATGTWENQKAGDGASGFNNLSVCRGYIYRRIAPATLAFSGQTVWNTTGVMTHSIYATCDDNNLKGFNLVGNPYTHRTPFNHAHYTLNADGTWQARNSGVLAIGEAVMVHTTAANGEQLQFNNSMQKSSNASEPTESDMITFTVAGGGFEDVAYALLGSGDDLPKLRHIVADAPMLGIPVNGRDFAIATLADDVKLFPLALQALAGEYTLSVEATDDVAYLHLIDLSTGKDVDLLRQPTYTFTQPNSPTVANRFMIRLSPEGQESGSSRFAYQNGNEIVIYGTGTLEAFDIMGRRLFAKELSSFSSVLSTSLFPGTGVYILRLGEKSQKIVVK